MTPSPKTNDFNLYVATVNGTGSQSANKILFRSLFYMGIPVSAKNIFPSNIKGLPTWFIIRASKDGWEAFRKDTDVLVCMNPETAHDDIRQLTSGKVVLYNQSISVDEEARNDLFYFSCPFDTLAKDVSDNAKLRKLIVNVVYVGALAELLGIGPEALERAVKKEFASKPKAVDINLKALEVGRAYAKEHFDKTQTPFRVEAMDKTKSKILIEGNEAMALGALFGGCTVLAWYPITPSSSVCEKLIAFAEKYRRDEKGKMMFAPVQAEDELSSAGAVLGAGWAGARAMTATSGPGLSLMTEFIGLAYYAEVPSVFVNVQRMGPSTGLPTRTAQGDIISTAFASHGDTEHILLFPSSVKEGFEMMGEAFDLAERYQTPIFVMSDLDLGMNSWMSERFDYPDKPFDRGKVLSAEALAKLKDWGRYRDVDGDGIAYRTIPGTESDCAAYFTRGSGHNRDAKYTESGEDYVKNIDRIRRKIEGSADTVSQPIEIHKGKAPAGLLAFGTSHPALLESLPQIQDRGMDPSYLLLRALPINGAVRAFFEKHERVYVVEQNRDGQMASIFKMKMPDLAPKIRSILHYDGWPLDAASVTAAYLKQEKGI